MTKEKWPVQYTFDVIFSLPWSLLDENVPKVPEEKVPETQIMGSYSWAEEQRKRLHVPSEVYYCVIAPLVAKVLTGTPANDVKVMLHELGMNMSDKTFETLIGKAISMSKIPTWSKVRHGSLKDLINRWLNTSGVQTDAKS